MVESLVDLFLRVPEEEQAQLLAQTLSALGDLFLQKSGLVAASPERPGLSSMVSTIRTEAGASPCSVGMRTKSGLVVVA